MRKHLPLSQLLVYLGILLLVFSVILQGREQFLLQQAQRASLSEPVLTLPTPAPTPLRNPSHQPVHITIPGYIDSAITSEFYQDGIWSISATSASHLQTSAYPGEPNNIIIYGHNKNSIFGPIRWLTGSEEIQITLADGTSKNYTITEMIQVKPDQVQFLHPTESEVLTMYTCAGPFDSERFIVRALPSEVLAATLSAQLAASQDTETAQAATMAAALSPNSYQLITNPFVELLGWNYYNWRTSYEEETNL